jgi:hypothetical protein
MTLQDLCDKQFVLNLIKANIKKKLKIPLFFFDVSRISVRKFFALSQCNIKVTKIKKKLMFYFLATMTSQLCFFDMLNICGLRKKKCLTDGIKIKNKNRD